MRRAIAGVPNEVVIDDKVMGTRTRLQVVSLELSGGGLEVGDVIATLPDEPDAPLSVNIGVARPRVLPGHCPFRDLGGIFSREERDPTDPPVGSQREDQCHRCGNDSHPVPL